MATQGALFWIDRTLKKLEDGTLNLNTMAIKAVLLSNSQAVARGFTGSSGEAKYADLTGELATANGYTAGGVSIGTPTFNRLGTNQVIFSSPSILWTLTGSITFKYMALYVSGSANAELLMVTDMDTGGGTVTALAGALQFNPDPTYGWGYFGQP